MKIEFSSQRREMLLFLTTKIAAVTSRAKLAPVVQKMDIGIQWINIRESNCAILRIKIYPVDSAIHLLNNWYQRYSFSLVCSMLIAAVYVQLSYNGDVARFTTHVQSC